MHGRRFSFRRWIATVLVGTIASAGFTITAPPLPARASSICPPLPGKDGTANFGTNNGVENAYFIPATGTVAAGATTLTLSSATADTSAGGANIAIAVNDELLVIQMQGGTFNYVNSSAYGGGGSSGNGYTSIGKAGLYEYVYVTAISGTAVTIKGAGSGGGLINSYTEAAATSSTGQQTYQIVRVPQYLTATLTSAFHAAYWNGKSGGVAALDIASTTNLGGATIYATGNGFRGGAYTVASTTPATVLNNDFMDSVTMNGTGLPGQGTKGEGFLGTPQYLFYYTTFTTPSTPAGATAPTPAPVADGYPGGDQAMGAPGNAGGGGTDSDPASNDQNTGGGGGGNGGAGGHGGYPWTPNYDAAATPTAAPQYSASGLHAGGSYTDFNSATPNFPQNPGDIGGRGAAAIAAGDISPGRVLMGGGGGAGVNNNASDNNSYNAFGSSGGVGGGIVMMRIAQTSGTGATIYANGTTGLAPLNDGGGGGGAGGTVVVTSPETFTGVTVNVNGAAGTTANASNTGFNQQHGPGGGGGGGVAYTSSSIAFSATGGAAGTTTTFVTTYGAQPGTAGFSQIITPQQIPGVASGAECYSSGGSLFTGPVSNYSASGSYDGSVPTTNNNDFTAASFSPTGTPPANSSTVAGSPIGNTLGGPTTVNVQNEFEYTVATTTQTVAVSLTVVAPSSPTGWTAQICPKVGSAPQCTGTVTNWGTPGTAGSTSTTTYTIPANTAASAIDFFVVYSAPTGVTAFSRYDATITATTTVGANTYTNVTHNELYAGYVVLTKSVTVLTSNCSGSPPAGEVCPGGTLLYTIDYRNIMVGGASESTLTPSPLLATSKTSSPLAINDNGTTTWGANSGGLLDALVAGANGTTTFGDSTTGSTFAGGTVGSKNFTCTIGGSGFSLVAPGVTGTSQGTITYRVKIN